MPWDLVTRYQDFGSLWDRFRGLPWDLIGPGETVLLERLADGPRPLGELASPGTSAGAVETAAQRLADHNLVRVAGRLVHCLVPILTPGQERRLAPLLAPVAVEMAQEMGRHLEKAAAAWRGALPWREARGPLLDTLVLDWGLPLFLRCAARGLYGGEACPGTAFGISRSCGAVWVEVMPLSVGHVLGLTRPEVPEQWISLLSRPEVRSSLSRLDENLLFAPGDRSLPVLREAGLAVPARREGMFRLGLPYLGFTEVAGVVPDLARAAVAGGRVLIPPLERCLEQLPPRLREDLRPGDWVEMAVSLAAAQVRRHLQTGWPGEARVPGAAVWQHLGEVEHLVEEAVAAVARGEEYHLPPELVAAPPSLPAREAGLQAEAPAGLRGLFTRAGLARAWRTWSWGHRVFALSIPVGLTVAVCDVRWAVVVFMMGFFALITLGTQWYIAKPHERATLRRERKR